MPDDKLAVGDRFTVKESVKKPVEMRGKKGELLVRFLPGYVYRTTGKNMKVANKMLADGDVVKGGLSLGEKLEKAGINFGAKKADVKGSVTVKPKRNTRRK